MQKSEMRQKQEPQNFHPKLLREVYAAWSIHPKDAAWKRNLHAALQTIEATEEERETIYKHVQSLLRLEQIFKKWVINYKH